MDREVFLQAFEEFLKGKSARKIEEDYHINRDTFVRICRENLPEGSKRRQEFEERLAHNKELSRVEIGKEDVRSAFFQLVNGEKGLMDLASELGVHYQTLRERLIEFVNNSQDEEIKRRYVEYKQKANPDYSFINFKALIIEMIREDMSQSEIARVYGIPPRTVSRELDKLKYDEYYESLYRIGKEHSERKMKRKPFTNLESYLIDNTLSGFVEGPVIIDDSIPKEKQEYLKQKKILERADSIEGTNKDKAKALGISVSTLRRMRIKVAEYEKLEEQKDEEGKEDR